jgi:hypothetical protein
MRTRHEAKLTELQNVLVNQGYRSLDEQADVLGLGRSTTWVILQNHHKCSGLRATTIHRMLSSDKLPPAIRRILAEYIEEKSAGAYGHSDNSLRKFRARLEKLGTMRRLTNRA